MAPRAAPSHRAVAPRQAPNSAVQDPVLRYDREAPPGSRILPDRPEAGLWAAQQDLFPIADRAAVFGHTIHGLLGRGGPTGVASGLFGTFISGVVDGLVGCRHGCQEKRLLFSCEPEI
jgi:hypothetical protein